MLFNHARPGPALLALLTTAFAAVTVTTAATITQDADDTFSSTALNYPYDYSSLSCPSSSSSSSSSANSSTLLTPTYGEEGAVFTVCSSITISAPATVIRHAVLDFKSYARWNSFVVSVSLPSNVTDTPRDEYVGMPMTFTTSGLLAGLNTTSDEILTNLDFVGIGAGLRPYLLVSWRYDDKLGGVGARAEHPVVIVDLGWGSSRVLSYETFYVGLLTPTIALLKAKQQEQFDAQSADLKAYVEGFL